MGIQTVVLSVMLTIQPMTTPLTVHLSNGVATLHSVFVQASQNIFKKGLMNSKLKKRVGQSVPTVKPTTKPSRLINEIELQRLINSQA